MNFPILLFLNLKMTVLRICQQICLVPFYFEHPLLKLDLLFLKSYIFCNPYKACKNHFKKQSKQAAVYGDTWPFAVPHFVRWLNITKEDVLYDIGSGTSRVSFWFQIFSGCRVKAIEIVPIFIQKGKKIKDQLKNERIEFIEKDFLDIDYQNASILYFHGSSFSDEVILKLIDKWKHLKKGTKIITTSFSLLDYGVKNYEIVNQFKISYPFGKCMVTYQVKVS